MFVIQTLPRCGTHMVWTALQRHASLRCYGEVFNPFSRIHGYPSERPAVEEVIEHCRSQRRPTGFLAHAYVGLEDEETGAGIDLDFRRQVDVAAGRGLWRALPPETQVVTLYRANLLERYVSFQIARQCDVWAVACQAAVPPPIAIQIDCQHMWADFARTESLLTIARRRFPHALPISYEQLCHAPHATLASMQRHLSVEPQALRFGTQKLGWPLAKSIQNLEEVRAALCGTRYESLL